MSFVAGAVAPALLSAVMVALAHAAPAPFNATLQHLNEPVPEGYAAIVPHERLNANSYTPYGRNQKVSDEGKYIFQVFPGTRVPVSSLVCVLIPFAFLLFVSASYIIARIFWSPMFSSINSTLLDREKAFQNVRLVGIRDEENDDEKAISTPEHVSEPMTMSSQNSKDTEICKQGLSSEVPASEPARESSKSKGKDANEISGPIVPVLRNDDLLDDESIVSDAEDSEDHPEDYADELSHFNLQNQQAPADAAPSYEAANQTHPSQETPSAVVEPTANPVLTEDKAQQQPIEASPLPNDAPKPEPAIMGSACLPGDTDMQASRHGAYLGAAEQSEQNSMLP